MVNWLSETLYPAWEQRFRVDEVLFQEKTALQDLVILKNEMFGTVMMLDGVVQLTEKDEFVYHEMLAHVPVFGHGSASRVLIIGGGDGGTLREVLRHRSVTHVTQVEIDRAVIDMALKYMPGVSAGAYDDPRARIIIADGIRYVAETEDRYDVILVDSTDPVGPAEGLFTEEFYRNCKRCLTENGILAVQGGVPFLQPEERTLVNNRMKPSFRCSTSYIISMATYVGGPMTLGWASDDPSKKTPDLAVLEQRYREAGFSTRYYSPAVHIGAFALPPYIAALENGPA
ncbi:polyamine aminopropyltransferase [Phaeovibrio sulfidiphilus]|uniref:Polyamine aminopropyltransferase n=1 Tax=Phaeovibrio sulfidiphilus TaxID=1220600 RepID=A0A8J7CRK2_9PROT|nr:polyamine aminopropyltransferase [Phaeovibrio sulfidiphilus]MBE1237650.1 polyamine aminopropyltransferase [Phaeovibrio sulfidiphilus]